MAHEAEEEHPYTVEERLERLEFVVKRMLPDLWSELGTRKANELIRVMSDEHAISRETRKRMEAGES